MKNPRHGEYDKNRIPLRIYYAHTTLITMLVACCISCALVCVGIVLFYHKELTTSTLLLACMIICCLTCLIGEHMLLKKARDFIKPIEKVTEAVKEVMVGDFEVQIEENSLKTRIDEMQTLIENFNTMASELNGMDYMRKDFMSNVSHEIKTPIAAISGFTEILQADGLSEEERKEYLSLVHDEAKRLSRLCESMLNMSRLDNQEIIARHESVRIDEQIRKAIILLAEKWEAKEQEFDLELEEITLYSDPDLLSQIWINLIDNAMKYSQAGTTIHICAKSGFYEGKSCEIVIKDEGPGIPEQQLPFIFDKFYQCDESHKKQGNGLGLSIVKRIVTLLDGKIDCTSSVGRGTTFTIWL